MKNLLTAIVLATAFFGAAAVARASAPVAPQIDVFEDGGQKLRLVALPSTSGEGVEVTLVYEDGESKTYRAATVNPKLVGTTHSSSFKSFLAAMDPEFLSFVKASLADRLLHMNSEPSMLDRAESEMFFPGADPDVAVSRARSARAERAKTE